MADDEWEGDERRGQPRVSIDGGLQGEIEAAVEAPLMDLSLSGALLEVPSALPAGARYALKLPAAGEEIPRLTAEVVRSYVHGFDKEGTGPPSVRYRAAVKFVELTAPQRAGIEKLLAQSDGSSLRAELSN